MRILIGARFLQKVFNNVLVKKFFLKAKENVALISWVLSYFLNRQYFIKSFFSFQGVTEPFLHFLLKVFTFMTFTAAQLY